MGNQDLSEEEEEPEDPQQGRQDEDDRMVTAPYEGENGGDPAENHAGERRQGESAILTSVSPAGSVDVQRPFSSHVL